jgi:hypothetical protein
MTLKQKNFREREHDNSRGKKRYRERLVEDEEAEKEINDFDRYSEIPQDEGPDRENSSFKNNEGCNF